MTSLDGGQHYPFDLRELPLGWSASLIKDLVTELRPGFPSGDHNKTGAGVAHLRPMNIDRDGRLDLSDVKYVADAKPQRVEVGDVLFNNTNSPALIGKTTAITQEGDFAYSNHMTRLRLRPGVASVFIARQLHYLWMSGYFRHRCVNHVNQASIGTTALSETVPLLLPPLPEQRRIVAKIEELFSDLDAGVAALERVRANLKRYRAAVLKAAVEGRLTEEWRTRHPATEPAAKLLERILAERRAKWEQDQLRKFKEAGKTPPKGWKEKYEESTLPATENLPALPRDWRWSTVDQLISYLRNGWSLKPNPEPPGHRLLRISAVRSRSVDLSQVRFVPQKLDEVADYFIEDGDLLFTRYNGSVDLLGVCGLVRGCSEPTLHPDKLIRVKAVLGQPLNAYLEIASNVGESRRHMKSRARTTAGQTGISGPDVREMPIPLPPLAEQAEIVAEVDRRLSVADAAEMQVEHALLRAARLRQAILKRAFEGKLVPQDPSDAPLAMPPPEQLSGTPRRLVRTRSKVVG